MLSIYMLLSWRGATLILAPLLLTAVATYIDIRTHRGYGLTALALAASAFHVWRALAEQQALQQTSDASQLNVAIAFVVLLLIGVYYALLLWVGALIEAGVALWISWLVGLGLAALASIAIFLLPVLGILQLSAVGLGFILSDPATQNIMRALVVAIPTLVVLIHGIVRSIRPPQRPVPRAQQSPA